MPAALGILLAIAAAASQSNRETLLADSALAYDASGGIAGRRHQATLTSKDGAVTVTFLPEHSDHRAAPLTAAITAEAYLAIWREAEAAGVWSLKVPSPDVHGADFIQRTLTVRAGAREHVVTWNDLNAHAPGAKAAAAIAQKIVAAARNAATSR